MTPLGKSNPELKVIIDSLVHTQTLLWYDGELLSLYTAKDGTPWLFSWADGEQVPDIDGYASTRDVYFELGLELFATFKDSLTPLREIMRAAKSVIVRDHYYIPFSNEGSRDEYALFSAEECCAKFDDCLPEEGHIFEYEKEE
jgi:hypothetical protein